METFNGLHIITDQKQVEITSCEHLTEGILSPFNKNRKNKLSLFSDASDIFLYFTECRLTLDMKF